MKIKSAKYLTSATSPSGILNDAVPEFAFVGRSNVGKSSLINALTNQRHLAKTSQTAGLTKMINYFDIDGKFRLVDLPGYGYAKVGKGQLDVWSGLMGQYLLNCQSLLTVFVLVDVRIDPTELDKDMLTYLIFHNIPFRLVATKCDKISKSALKNRIDKIASSLNVRRELILPTSSADKQGIEPLLQYIEGAIENASR